MKSSIAPKKVDLLGVDPGTPVSARHTSNMKTGVSTVCGLFSHSQMLLNITHWAFKFPLFNAEITAALALVRLNSKKKLKITGNQLVWI